MKKFATYLFFVLLTLISIACEKSPSQKANDLIGLGMHQEAIELIKSEILKNPNDGELHYTLALVYIEINKNRLAGG